MSTGVNIRPGMSVDEVAQRTSEAFKQTGVKVIKRIKDEAQRSFTSASYVPYQNFRVAFRSSGGLVDVMVNLRMYTPSPQTAFARLMVDGKEEDRAISIGQDGTNPTLSFRDVLNEGDHKIAVEVKINGGTLNLNDDGSTGATISTMSVVEFLGA